MLVNGITAFKRSELYTYDEAAAIIGVRYASICEAVRYGVLTSTRIPSHPNKKFVLKSEVNPIAGSRRVTSKKARMAVELERQRNASQAQPVKEFNLDGTPDWISKTELVTMLMEMGFHFERLLSVKMQEMREQFLQEVRELSGSFSAMLETVIEMSREPGGNEMMRKVVDDLRKSNQQRMADPTTPLTPLEQSLVDSIDPEERAELEAMGREMFGGAE